MGKKRGARRPSELLRDRLSLKRNRSLTVNMPAQSSKVSNRYEILTDSDISLSDDEIFESEATSAKSKVKVPPIVFPDLDRKTIEVILNELKIANFNIKLMSKGKKLLLTTNEDYDKVNQHLVKTKVHFYTHQRANERPIKIVLSGLHSMETEVLKKHLSDLGLKVTDVKSFNFAKKKFAEHATYLLYFERGSVKIADLRKNHHAIMHTIVYWSYYKNRRNSPTQCRNCQRFGHGSSNCYLPARCMICAEGHNHNECPQTEQAKIKCANCGKNHQANDNTCDSRRIYMEIKNKANSRSKPTLRKNPVYNYQEQHFPAFTRQQSQQNVHFPSAGQSFSGILRNDTPTSRRSSFANNFTMRPQNTEDLFTADQLIKLSTELIGNLAKCKTKADQYQVIVELAAKFLYS